MPITFSTENNRKGKIILNTRHDLLRKIPKNTIGIEIGVHNGDNALDITNIIKPKKLYLIDAWPDYVFDFKNLKRGKKIAEESYNKVISKFKNFSNVEIRREFSVEAANNFPDDFFDWIYIDASHRYEEIKRDLDAWYPKLKSKGVFCGDDYIDKKGGAAYDFGVVQAVNEFLDDKNLILEYTTNKNDPKHPSPQWAIIKP